MTAGVSVLGRDPGREAYRLRTPEGEAWLPERLCTGLRPGSRPSHEDAYVFIARNRTALSRAISDLVAGRRPRAPFDQLFLAEPKP